jgi:hypothetical protein
LSMKRVSCDFLGLWRERSDKMKTTRESARNSRWDLRGKRGDSVWNGIKRRHGFLFNGVTSFFENWAEVGLGFSFVLCVR